MHVRIYRIRLYEILFNANTVVNDNGGTRPPIDLNNNASSRSPRPSPVQQYQLQFLYPPPPPPSRAKLQLFTGNGYFLLFHFPRFIYFIVRACRNNEICSHARARRTSYDNHAVKSQFIRMHNARTHRAIVLPPPNLTVFSFVARRVPLLLLCSHRIVLCNYAGRSVWK